MWIGDCNWGGRLACSQRGRLFSFAQIRRGVRVNILTMESPWTSAAIDSSRCRRRVDHLSRRRAPEIQCRAKLQGGCGDQSIPGIDRVARLPELHGRRRIGAHHAGTRLEHLPGGCQHALRWSDRGWWNAELRGSAGMFARDGGREWLGDAPARHQKEKSKNATEGQGEPVSNIEQIDSS
jgi:hypothetical protein